MYLVHFNSVINMCYGSRKINKKVSPPKRKTCTAKPNAIQVASRFLIVSFRSCRAGSSNGGGAKDNWTVCIGRIICGDRTAFGVGGAPTKLLSIALYASDSHSGCRHVGQLS